MDVQNMLSTSKTYLKFHILLVWSFTMVKSVNDGEMGELNNANQQTEVLVVFTHTKNALH